MTKRQADVPPIDSPTNGTVRLLRDLAKAEGRREHGCFLVEGTRLVAEAVAAHWPMPVALFDAARAAEDDVLAALVGRIPAALPATSRAIKHAADTVSPQGIVAAASLPGEDAAPDPAEPLVLVLDGLSDPGNLGALLRSALGAGIRTVIASRGSADLFSPKVVRAAMGAHFQLKLRSGLDWAETRDLLGASRAVVVADSGATTPYYEYDWGSPSALIIGSEAWGPSAEIRAAATASVSIPLDPRLESLNAAIAGSVILFEARRQANSSQPTVRRRLTC